MRDSAASSATFIFVAEMSPDVIKLSSANDITPLLSVIVFILSYFLFLPSTTKIHLDYSNSQIDFIITNLRGELREALIELIEAEYAQ